MNVRRKIGKRRKKRAKEAETERKPPSQDMNTIHESVLSEMNEGESRSDHGVVAVDTGVDEVIEIFLDKIEPAMSEVMETAPSEHVEVLKEMKGLLDEAIYPYLKQFADFTDELVTG